MTTDNSGRPSGKPRTVESLETVWGRWLAADARARTVERMFRPLWEERDALDAKLAALETSLRGLRPPQPLDLPAT